MQGVPIFHPRCGGRHGQLRQIRVVGEGERPVLYRGGKTLGPQYHLMGDSGGEGQGGAVVLCGVLPSPAGQGGTGAASTVARDAGAPKWTSLLDLGDLNADLGVPRITQDDILAVNVSEFGLSCSTCHYLSRTTRHVWGRWTFCGQPARQRGSGDGCRASPTMC